MGGLPGRLPDVLGHEERESEAHPITGTIAGLLASRPRIYPWVFTNTKTERPYTTIRKVFERALRRAKITTGDVTIHTLRHTALSRMIEHGLADHTVMSISGHSSTRMLESYTHPTVERKRAALETFDSLATNWHKNFTTIPYKEKSRPRTTFS